MSAEKAFWYAVGVSGKSGERKYLVILFLSTVDPRSLTLPFGSGEPVLGVPPVGKYRSGLKRACWILGERL